MRKRVFILGAGDCYEVCQPLLERHYDILGLVETHGGRLGEYVGAYRIHSLDEVLAQTFDHLLILTLRETSVLPALAAAGLDMRKVLTLDQCPAILAGLDALVFTPERSAELDALYAGNAVPGKTRLLFAINSLGGGGAEKALINLLNNLDYSRYDVTLLLVVRKGLYLQQVPPQVRVGALFEEREDVIRGMLVCKFAEPEALHRFFVRAGFDVEIAYLEGWAAKIIAGGNARRLCWIHCDLLNHHWTEPCFAPGQDEAANYAGFDHLVFVAESARRGFAERFGAPKVPTSVIENFFERDAILEKAGEAADPFGKFTFVSVGRMVPVKGFDRLIDAHARLRAEGSDHQLVLVGEGKEQDALMEQARRLNAVDSVKFLGFQSNPYRFIARADAFISSSFSEGHPLVLGEALTLGVPVVATDCEGNRGMLADGTYGLLVENSTEGLIDGMRQMLADDVRLEHCRKAALARAALDKAPILRRIESLFQGTEPGN